MKETTEINFEYNSFILPNKKDGTPDKRRKTYKMMQDYFSNLGNI